MSVEKNLGTLFLFSKSNSKIIKGVHTMKTYETKTNRRKTRRRYCLEILRS